MTTNNESNREETRIVEKYAQQMNMVKLRINAIDAILSKKYTTPYAATNIELCCLQLRKCIELVIMASLVANSTEYQAAYARLGRDWKANCISKDLSRINSEFYPHPIKIIKKEGKPDKFVDLDPSEYITCEQMMEYYEKIGAIMHSENPFGAQIDYSYYEKLVTDCRAAVIKLLKCHLAHLCDGKSVLYITMKADVDEKVHVCYFQKISEEDTHQ